MLLTVQEIENLQQKGKSLLQGLNLPELLEKREKIQKELENPTIWDNPTLAGKLNKELTLLNQKIEQIETLESELENLDLAQELEENEQIEQLYASVEEKISVLQRQRFLDGRFDYHGAILSLHAGAGGVDAQDWAATLASMYQAFCKNQGWKCEIISLSSGEEGGVKNIMMNVNGEAAYGLLKEEIGVHRLVRLSPFNAGKTRETSFAMLEVLPQGLETEIEINLDEKDLRWDYFMSSGKGGQSVNTTYSAVRVVHLPTSLSVTCQNQRSQIQNKQEALKYLKNKLAVLELQKQKEFVSELKGDLVKNEWGSQIRSYVLHPYKMVKDHRSAWETSEVLDILEQGNLSEVIWSVKMLSAKE